MDAQVKKRLTLNDIAQLTGLSKTTVSMVLNGKSDRFRISPETQEKVRQVVEKHGYRANAYAKALQAQRTNVIGLVVPDLTNYGFALTAKTLEKLCRQQGLYLLIACSDDDPQQEKMVIERLLDRQVDLIVTAPTHQDASYYKKVIKHTPIVQIDRHIPTLTIPSLASDDTPYIAQLVENIVRAYELNEFYYFGGQLSLSPSASRLEGFYEGLEQAKLTPTSGWILHKDYQSDSGYEMMKETVEQLGRLPQAVFTGAYTLMEGVLRYLTEHHYTNKVLNGELVLATFDDHHMLNALPFKVHSIKQLHEEIAHQAFEMIQARLQGHKVKNQKIACEIIWRH